MRYAEAKCAGSCGELIQGWYENSTKLVTCGINSFSQVRILWKKSNKNCHTPLKIRKALSKTLDYLDLPVALAESLEVEVTSSLAIAKGMSSSTADIAAACLATAAFFRRALSTDEIIEICVEIEATDSMLFPSLTFFDPNKGTVREKSGWAPRFYTLVLEPERQLLTEEFHNKSIERQVFNQRFAFKNVYGLYQQAVMERSLDLLGKAAFESAVLNQQVLSKPAFDLLAELVENFCLMGMNVAHSGTVIGLLFKEREAILPVIHRLKELNIQAHYPTIKIYRSCYEGVQLVN